MHITCHTHVHAHILSLQTKLRIIAASTAAAAAVRDSQSADLSCYILTAMLVRKAKSNLKKGPGSSKLTVDNGTVLDTNIDTEILVEVNAAYTVTT